MGCENRTRPEIRVFPDGGLCLHSQLKIALTFVSLPPMLYMTFMFKDS